MKWVATRSREAYRWRSLNFDWEGGDVLDPSFDIYDPDTIDKIIKRKMFWPNILMALSLMVLFLLARYVVGTQYLAYQIGQAYENALGETAGTIIGVLAALILSWFIPAAVPAAIYYIKLHRLKQRAPKGCCTNCGYHLQAVSGLIENGRVKCSECGESYAATTMKAPRT